MDSFHLTVLTVASIILIISLATIGVVIQKSSSVSTFPPFASNCPDGWDSISGQPIRTIPGSIVGTILTVDSSTPLIPNGTIIHGNGIPRGTKVDSRNDSDSLTYNLSHGPTTSISETLFTLITPNDDNKRWYTCVAPIVINATASGSIAWDKNGNYISYDDNTSSICDKKKWTASNNIVWDGVSNYNNC
jgi:hypothetical protein